MRTQKQIEKVVGMLNECHNDISDKSEQLEIEVMTIILNLYKNHNQAARKAIKYLTDKTENDSILFE